MVCVPCFIIPVLLYIWHKFIQPIMLKYWNPWEKKDAQGNVIKEEPKFPFECKGGACPFPRKDKPIADANATDASPENTTTSTGDDSKKDN